MYSALGVSIPTVDYVFSIDPAAKERIWTERDGRQAEVIFSRDRAELKALVRRLAQEFEFTSHPGGNVCNAISHLAMAWNRQRSDSVARFVCPAPYSYDIVTQGTFDALRQRGVECRAMGGVADEKISLCFVDRRNGEKLGILATLDAAPVDYDGSPLQADMLVAAVGELSRSASFLASQRQTFSDVALVTTDSDSLTSLLSVSESIASRHRYAYLFGSRREFLDAFGIDLRSAPAPGALAKFEVVLTDDAERVWVKERGAASFRPMEIGRAAERSAGVNELGVGDAFVGGYLSRRTGAAPIADSVDAGVEAALACLASPHAHGKAEINLNTVFGYRIDRASESKTDGAMFELVRRRPGVVVLSCGQTGIDQLALQTAGRLGLPAFAVLPTGQRTETTEGLSREPDDFGGARVLELGSASYRFCTWSNAYLSDGTVLYDVVNGEGSAETRRACGVLRRPLFELAKAGEGSALSDTFAAWIRAHDIRILNVAGNRSRFLSAEQIADAKRKVEQCLMVAAVAREEICGRNSTTAAAHASPPPNAGTYGGLRLVAPKQDAVRRIIEQFLAQAHGAAHASTSSLHVAYAALDLEIYYVKSRDIPDLIAAGEGDMGICGSDMIFEAQQAPFEIGLRTGLQPCCLAVLTRPSTRTVHRIASQYPNVARSYAREVGLASDSVRAIVGGAEAYPHFGSFDAIVDTFRTGRTAEENDLIVRDMLHPTSLALFWRPDHQGAASRFAGAFRRWMRHPYNGAG